MALGAYAAQFVLCVSRAKDRKLNVERWIYYNQQTYMEARDRRDRLDPRAVALQCRDARIWLRDRPELVQPLTEHSCYVGAPM